MRQHGKPLGDAARQTIASKRVVCVVTALGLAAALGLSIMATAGGARPSRSPIAAAPRSALVPSRFILNALLVPALDGDPVPLRWVDPRPASRCGPNTTVQVNRAPLLAGALVPDTPFELDWQMDGCRPFGAHGPRFDGRVRLTVFREDWGFSAVVEPSGLRVASTEDETILIGRGTASLPQCIEADDPDELDIGVEGSRPCR
jgi:hypothetical protein